MPPVMLSRRLDALSPPRLTFIAILFTGLRGVLRHRVKCASILEPFELTLVERVRKLSLPNFARFGVYPKSDRLSNGELGAEKVDFVVGVDLVVVFWITEGQREHPLLLQVRFVLHCL